MSMSRRLMIVGFVLIALAIIFTPILTPVFVKLKNEAHVPVAIGYVDVQKVFESSARGKLQIASFQEELSTRSTQVKQMNEKLESMKHDLQILIQKGDKATVERKLPEFQAAQKKLAEAQQEASMDLQKTQADVDKAFMVQLKGILDEVRKEDNLDVIQAYDPNKTLSYDPKLDVTQKALIKYNKKYPAEEEGKTPAADSKS